MSTKSDRSVISFMSLLEKLVDKSDVNPSVIENLTKMNEIDINRRAEVAYNVAMVQVQRIMPVIPEDAKNESTHSTYALYKTVLKQARPIYTKEGFALIFSEGETDKVDNIRVCLKLLHSGGHFESLYADIPLDMTGIKGKTNKTKVHSKGSSFTYGKQYLIRMAFNMATGDDDDGNGAGGSIGLDENNTPDADLSKSNDAQIKRIKDLRDDINLKEDAFKARLKKRFGKDCPRDLTHDEADELIRALNVIKMRG